MYTGCLAFFDECLQLFSVIFLACCDDSRSNNAFFGHRQMCFISKEGGVYALMPHTCIRIRRQAELLNIVCYGFFQQVKWLQNFRYLCDSRFVFDEGNELLAILDFVFENIGSVLYWHFGFSRLIHGVHGFTQFPRTILQDFLRRLLVVA
ncbi:hypothetical protein D3C76_888490 [compost metagenome]